MEKKFGYSRAKEMREMRELVFFSAEYVPTPIQKEVIEAGRLTKLLSGGVRAGKSITSSMLLAEFIIFEDEEIWIVGDTYEAARQEFNYLYAPLFKLGLTPADQVSRPDQGRWKMIVSGGAVIRTKSSKDLTTLASVAPIAQLYTEAAQQQPDIFDKASERNMETDSLIVYSGTLEASKQMEFTNKLESWREPPDKDPTTPQSWTMPTWSNTYIFPGGRQDPKILRAEKDMPPDKFNERVAAIPYKPSGLVHKTFGPRNLADITLDLNKPVHVAIDPAYRSYVLIFLQKHGEYVHVLDEIYRHEIVTSDIIDEAMHHPLWKHVTWGIIDVAARAHSANDEDKMSVFEKWVRHTGIQFVTKRVSIDGGIDAVEIRCKDGEDGQPRLLLSNKMKFDMGGDGRANSMRAEFLSYRWPKFKVGRRDGVKPIDANNHAVKALGYYLVHWYGQEDDEKEQPSDRGKRTALPSRLERYILPKPEYGGNKSRWQAIMGARSRRRR